MWPFDSPRRISENDLGDLHGKVVIVTGGYSGIGYCTTQFLARKGAKVYLATRNKQGTQEAIDKLEKEGIADGSLHWLKIELEDPRSAKGAAEEFLKKEDRLDILLNNAAKVVGPFGMTKDGLRDSMAIKFLSESFCLHRKSVTLLIQTSKQEGSDVRIINVSSRSHNDVSPTSFVGKHNLNTTYGSSWKDDLSTYGLSKLANVLHTKHLQRRLDAQEVDIICMSIHPGTVGTPALEKFVQHTPLILRPVVKLVLKIISTPMREGAMNSTYTAASPEVKAKAQRFKGAYINPVGKIVPGSRFAREDRLGNELYETTLEVLKELKL